MKNFQFSTNGGAVTDCTSSLKLSLQLHTNQLFLADKTSTKKVKIRQQYQLGYN